MSNTVGRTVSVIIPTYNRARSLTLAIDSVLAQSHEDVEVLVIDDGSTDNTRAVVAERYGAEPRVNYSHGPNRGVASARNKGLATARGDFIAFLDSDDLWLPGKLSLQLACLEAVPEAGMVWTDMDAVDERGEIVQPRFLRVMYHAYRRFPRHLDLFSAQHPLPGSGRADGLYSGDIFSQMVLGSLVHTSTVLLRRERAHRAGGFREDFKTGEDYGFHLRVCREGPVAFADVVTINYRVGSADALSQPNRSFEMATAFLATAQEALARDPDRITVPKSWVSDALARGYAWAGRAALDSNRLPESRRMYLSSLRLRPFRWDTIKFFGVSLLPRPASRALFHTVRAWRKFRSRLQRRAGHRPA